MFSPHSVRWLRKHTLVLVPALLAAAGTPAAWAQDTAAVADTAAARRDSAAPGDSLTGTGQSSATGGPSGTRSDSLRADSVPPPSARARPAPPPPRVDSALTIACLASGGGPPDLVAVTFRASATAADRRAAARAVGGTLLGRSEHQAPGAWYVGAPGGSGDPAVADQLILLPSVVAVEAIRCPS